MFSLPSICCLCLTADRQALTDRAVRSFHRQSYQNRWMLVFDSGAVPYRLTGGAGASKVVLCYDPTLRGATVGALRNEAIGLTGRADLIAHWDSDDWSHPERLALQLEDILAARATGFSNILFYDSRDGRGHAWEYTYTDRRRVLGTSLLYWRAVWEQCAFDEHKLEGEEVWWPDGHGARGTNGIARTGTQGMPLLIADYHGGNTGAYGRSHNTPVMFDQTPAQRVHNPQFRRAPEWDNHCREVMTL